MKLPRSVRKNTIFHVPFDINLIFCAVLLNIFGIIMIYSASYYYAESAYGYAPDYFFKNQLKYVIAGLLMMIFIGFIRPKFWKKFWLLALFAAIGMIILLRVPGIGRASHGAYRWLNIGPLSLQVAEPIKICMILFLGGIISEYRISEKPIFFFIFITVSVVAFALFIISNNLSTAIVIMMMMFFTLMILHPRTKWFWITLITGVVLALAVILVIDRMIPFTPAENFRITRIRAWLHPTNEDFADNEAYQATLALYAIANGGFFGKGLGQSLLKFKLPEPHNDFILAIVFEEMGIFGVCILTFLFVYLLYRIFRIYLSTKDRFSRVLVLGVFLHLAAQTILNYAVTLGLFPTMGVTLPFISAGGSAAFFTLIEIGFVLAVDRANTQAAIVKEVNKEMEENDPYYREYREGKRIKTIGERLERSI